MTMFLKKIASTFIEDDTPIPTIGLALRTGSVAIDGCGSGTLSTSCRILCQTSNEINTGDTLYTGISGTTPFNGANLYYRLVLQIWDEAEGSRICQISSLGIITVSTTCP